MRAMVFRQRLVAVILGLYLIIGITHSVVNPIFESSDEWSHYPFVAHVARGQGLPVQIAGEETLWRHEGSQPPLYYLLMGGLTSWIDTSDLETIMTPNPHARIGVPLARDNKNLIVHTEREAWPWRDTVLAVHLVRIASVLMGLVTVLCTYLIARELAPDRPDVALLAMALHAFLPMFAFITASVNNDNLICMLSALALLMILRMSRRRPTVRGLLSLGVVLGLAALSKLSGLVLLPIATLGVAVAHVRVAERPAPIRRVTLNWLRDMMIVAAPVVLIASWWYIRNIILYGDPTGLTVLNTFIEGRDNTPWWVVLAGEFEGFRINFWGLFGGVNVLMEPLWIYRVLDILSLIALAGLLVWVVSRIRTRRPAHWVELGLALSDVVLLAVGVARYSLSTPASQGRLVFPGLGAIMTFLALGLIGWPPRRWRPAMGFAIAALLFVLSITAPFTVIHAAYAPPPIVAETDLPPSMQPYGGIYGGVIKLLGYQFGKTRLRPGEELPVTLYWQATMQPPENYSLYIRVFGRNQRVLGQVDVYPGRGTLPTSEWLPHQVIVDTFYVPITEDPTGPVAGKVEAGLYRYEGREALPVTDQQGQVVGSPVLGRVKVYGKTAPDSPTIALNVQFGQAVRLTGYDLVGRPAPGAEVSLDLHWIVTGAVDRDYTVFVHLRDATNQTLAQADGSPLNDTYLTSFWEPGESLVDRHVLRLPDSFPEGTYPIAVGFYDPVTGERLPVVDAEGTILGDAAEGLIIER